jgi:predicted nucleotidyltransferase
MDTHGLSLPQAHQLVTDRFVAACQADARVVAAFLGGSYARGAADAYSDLDLDLITSDAAYDDFFAGREAFVRRLGEPVFLQDYHDDAHGGGVDFVFFTLADGTECEIGLARESQFTHLHAGPYRVLLDKRGILAGAVFPLPEVDQDEQTETLRSLISWFWHDLSHHFITPMARGQLLSAYGALEDLRRTCVNLARLSENFAAEAEGYEKVEQALPAERVAALAATSCPLERDAMLDAAHAIVRLYEVLAPPLAEAHTIPYPAELARMMSARLEQLCSMPIESERRTGNDHANA